MKRIVRLAIVAYAVMLFGGCSTIEGLGTDLSNAARGLRDAMTGEHE